MSASMLETSKITTDVGLLANKTAVSRKRPSVYTLTPQSKRGAIQTRALYVDAYDDICFQFDGLSHESSNHERTNDELDDILKDMSLLFVESKACLGHKSLSDLIELEWSSFFSSSNLADSKVQRAVKMCHSCGITTFRDILWYNNSLEQPASLQRFPICLVEMAYELHSWSPRRLCPTISRELWSSAWQALKIIWPNLVSSIPLEIRQVLLFKRHSRPPPTCNWFEFNYFDGVMDSKAPLLCYHDALEIAIADSIETMVSQSSVSVSDNWLLGIEQDVAKLLLENGEEQQVTMSPREVAS